MTDIVERLRLLVPSDSSGAAFDAVNEITRLRNELHIAQEWSAQVIAGQKEDVRQITALRAEVERLTARIRELEGALAARKGLHDGAVLAMSAHIKKLRAALKMARPFIGWAGYYPTILAEVDAALGEKP